MGIYQRNPNLNPYRNHFKCQKPILLDLNQMERSDGRNHIYVPGVTEAVDAPYPLIWVFYIIWLNILYVYFCVAGAVKKWNGKAAELWETSPW
jgi:hypothetical protein